MFFLVKHHINNLEFLNPHQAEVQANKDKQGNGNQTICLFVLHIHKDSIVCKGPRVIAAKQPHRNVRCMPSVGDRGARSVDYGSRFTGRPRAGVWKGGQCAPIWRNEKVKWGNRKANSPTRNSQSIVMWLPRASKTHQPALRISGWATVTARLQRSAARPKWPRRTIVTH